MSDDMGDRNQKPGTSAVVPDTTPTQVSKDGYGSTSDHIFKDPAVAAHWLNVYNGAKYENRHRFDPNYEWTAEEEKRLVRKVRGCLTFRTSWVGIAELRATRITNR
jgi:hypothetical protein